MSMQEMNDWRIGHPEESRKILSKGFSITLPGDAYIKAESVLRTARSASYPPEDLQLSISSENVLVVLHAFGKGDVGEKDYDLAKRIDKLNI